LPTALAAAVFPSAFWSVDCIRLPIERFVGDGRKLD